PANAGRTPRRESRTQHRGGRERMTLDTARATPAATGRGPQIDQLGRVIEANNHHFLEKASFRDRAWWQREAERTGSDWDTVIDWSLAMVASLTETSFERACRLADERRQ